jgi:hypothetical protein
VRNQIGPVVSGDDFFERPNIIRKIRRSLRNGNQVYLSAPRRVGKTSIMNFLLDNPEPGEQFVYVITQSIDDANAFYKEWAKAVMESPAFGKVSKASEALKKVVKGLLEHVTLRVSLPGFEVSTNNSQSLNFQLEFEKLLEAMDLDGQRLVIQVDEFTETLDNILNTQGKEPARRFLQSFRKLMHNRKLTGKVQFLLTGSIGLQPLVKKLESSDLINHLHVVDIPPLSDDEAADLLRQLLDAERVEMPDEPLRRVLTKIEWLMPFHVQLLAQELIDVYESHGRPLDDALADRAFDQIFHHRNKTYFEQYYERLKKRLGVGNDTKFAYAVLDRAARNATVSKAEAHDLAVKHEATTEYRATLESLLYDGYLHETPDGAYRFNSSILKIWWKKYVCA